MFELERAGAPIYAVYLNPAPPMRNAGVELYSTEAVEIQLPKEYEDYADVFSEEEADKMPDFVRVEHSIPIEEGKDVPFGPIYPLSANELRVLRDYLDSSLAKGWVRHSESPAGAPILFVPKKDGGLRLCVDYRGLNRVTVRNRHPLPLIFETLDRLAGARRYTKLDLRDAYHRIPVKREDQWKTAFRTRYGHFEYMVMPFGLTNAPATFQAYINEALKGLLNVICIVYLDDILIYSYKEEDHERHIRQVLERLQKFNLFIKLLKCLFSVTEVNFLGYRIDIAGISMNMRRVLTVVKWPLLKSFHDVQVFLRFANFYQQFIVAYLMVIAPMTDLLLRMQKGKKTGPFTWTKEADEVFCMLKECFLSAPLLQHFNPEKPSQVETDASGKGVAGILLQPSDESAGTE